MTISPGGLPFFSKYEVSVKFCTGLIGSDLDGDTGVGSGGMQGM